MPALAIALAFVTSGAAGAAQVESRDVADVRREMQIGTAYALSPYLRSSGLRVSVHGGKATLTGDADAGVNKALAKQIALGVDGISEVDNQIAVLDDRRSPQQGPAPGNSGSVAPRGFAAGTTAEAVAGRLAANTFGVVSVSNEMLVNSARQPPPAAPDNATVALAERDIADGWISTKVKSTYAYSTEVAGAGIGVSTHAGVVMLSGKVDSGAERALAIELAKNVRGVMSVYSGGLTF